MHASVPVFQNEKEKSIVIRRGKTDAIEERTDWYLNVGDAVGLKARGLQGQSKPTGNIIELKVRTARGKEVEEGAQKPAITWLLKHAEQWPKREMSERFLFKSVAPFTVRPAKESTRYRDTGLEEKAENSDDDEPLPCWKWKVLKRRFEALTLEKGRALDQLTAARLIPPVSAKEDSNSGSDSEDEPMRSLQTIAVQKRRQMVHFKSVDVDLLVGKKKKRVKRIEVTEIALGLAGSDGSSTPRQMPERWISICIEGRHAVPCAKLLHDLCPEIAFNESPDLFFGGYPGFIQFALQHEAGSPNTPEPSH